MRPDHDTGDPVSVERSRAEMLQDERQQDADMRAVLELPAGRRLLFHLLFSPTLGAMFDDASGMDDPRVTLGQQRVGLAVKDWVMRAGGTKALVQVMLESEALEEGKT